MYPNSVFHAATILPSATWPTFPKSVYSSLYSSLPSSAALSLNFAPAETFSSTVLVKATVFENDVVTFPVLFLAIIMMAITSEIRVTPKAVYKN